MVEVYFNHWCGEYRECAALVRDPGWLPEIRGVERELGKPCVLDPNGHCYECQGLTTWIEPLPPKRCAAAVT